MLVHHRVTPPPPALNSLVPIHTPGGKGGERSTVQVKYLAPEHNTMSLAPGLEPGPLNLESSALTMRPLHLPNLAKFQLHPNTGINTHHTNVIIYMYDSFVCSIFIQFRENKFLNTKHYTILSSNADNCPMTQQGNQLITKVT